MGDRDDDQQVKSCSEQSDEGQQNVNQHGLKVRTYWLPAGAVEELRKAEASLLQGLHHQREEILLSSDSLLTKV